MSCAAITLKKRGGMPAPKEVAKLINPFFKALGSAEEPW